MMDEIRLPIIIFCFLISTSQVVDIERMELQALRNIHPLSVDIKVDRPALAPWLHLAPLKEASILAEIGNGLYSSCSNAAKFHHVTQKKNAEISIHFFFFFLLYFRPLSIILPPLCPWE